MPRTLIEGAGAAPQAHFDYFLALVGYGNDDENSESDAIEGPLLQHTTRDVSLSVRSPFHRHESWAHNGCMTIGLVSQNLAGHFSSAIGPFWLASLCQIPSRR